MLAHFWCLVDFIINVRHDRLRGEAFLICQPRDKNLYIPFAFISLTALLIKVFSIFVHEKVVKIRIHEYLSKNIYRGFSCREVFFLTENLTKEVFNFNLIYLQLRSKEIDVSFASTKSVLRASQVKFEPRSDRLMGCSVNLLNEIKQIT